MVEVSGRQRRLAEAMVSYGLDPDTADDPGVRTVCAAVESAAHPLGIPIEPDPHELSLIREELTELRREIRRINARDEDWRRVTVTTRHLIVIALTTNALWAVAAVTQALMRLW